MVKSFCKPTSRFIRKGGSSTKGERSDLLETSGQRVTACAGLDPEARLRQRLIAHTGVAAMSNCATATFRFTRTKDDAVAELSVALGRAGMPSPSSRLETQTSLEELYSAQTGARESSRTTQVAGDRRMTAVPRV